MEPIKNEKKITPGQTIEKMNAASNKVRRSIVNYSGMIVGAFIVFVVIVVCTTDIRLANAMQWAELGLAFFILLFCSYSMYINYATSGTKAGKESTCYNDTLKEYNLLKSEVIKNKYQSRTPEFCRYYVDEELKNTKTSILSEVGIDYDIYKEKYLGKDKKELIDSKDLSKSQVAAIMAANKTAQIKLTSEMIFKRGRGNRSRSPLGIKPETKRNIAYGSKFISTAFTSLITGVIMLDVIAEPSWATFASCCLKVLLVIINGFMGYKAGYNNIVIDTVDYMNDQIDLMQQLIQYIEKHPEPEQTQDSTIKENESEPEIVVEDLEETNEVPANTTI
ncbi:MAG: hypothetical protein IKB70_09975 [Bacilli bacterium]|nr:hypothetical protein [Bacilli bacterium]